MWEWRTTTRSIAVAILATNHAFGAPATATPGVPLGTPVFAKVQGTGSVVNLAWWAVTGATVGYQVLRTPDPQSPPTTLATLPIGTLGYTDTQRAAGAQYYRLVALGAGASQSASAWFLLNTPTVTGVTPGASDTVIVWATAQPSPGGYEIWRTADPAQRASRVGTTPTGTLTFHDKQAAGGTQYYQVVALGAGGSYAASPWFPTHAAPTVAPSAVVSGAASAAPVGGANPPAPAPDQTGAPLNAQTAASKQTTVAMTPPGQAVSSTTVVPATTSVVTQATGGATLNAPVAPLNGALPVQAASAAPALSSSSLATSSPPTSGWSEKDAAIFAAAMAAMVADVESVIAAIWSAGGVVTTADQKELMLAASLTTAAAVAAIVSAVVTIISGMPIITPPIPAQVLEQNYSGPNGPIPAQLLDSYFSFPSAQTHQLTPQQVDQVILVIPTVDASASRFSNDVKVLLRKIKTRS